MEKLAAGRAILLKMRTKEKDTMEKLIVASNNKNKLKEFAAILGSRYEIVSMRDAGVDTDIEENGTTFEANALIKAEYVAKVTGCAAIADDSGLEVDALGGAPGVYSARYCGRHCDGEILFERRGTGGFGYDPLFVCETGETFAEVSAETKNAISHRKRGIEAVVRVLEEEEAQ